MALDFDSRAHLDSPLIRAAQIVFATTQSDPGNSVVPGYDYNEGAVACALIVFGATIPYFVQMWSSDR